MKKLFLLVSVVVFTMLSSCDLALLPEAERNPESYTSSFDLEYKTLSPQQRYLIPVAHNNISKEKVIRTVKGQGWITTALYLLDTDKIVKKEFVLVSGNSVSTTKNEAFPNRIIFSVDGQTVTHYLFPGKNGCYETYKSSFDDTDKTFNIGSSYSSWGENGKLVHLSSNTMVCVCTRGKDYNEQEIIYLEVLQRVSASERQNWVDNCPNKAIPDV